jgi:hypothetical protein
MKEEKGMTSIKVKYGKYFVQYEFEIDTLDKILKENYRGEFLNFEKTKRILILLVMITAEIFTLGIGDPDNIQKITKRFLKLNYWLKPAAKEGKFKITKHNLFRFHPHKFRFEVKDVPKEN